MFLRKRPIRKTTFPRKRPAHEDQSELIRLALALATRVRRCIAHCARVVSVRVVLKLPEANGSFRVAGTAQLIARAPRLNGMSVPPKFSEA
jgi:hypothetical protein